MRSDYRLLTKKSRPSQHVLKPQVITEKSTKTLRSPSYYRPKVVEDSADQSKSVSPHKERQGLSGQTTNCTSSPKAARSSEKLATNYTISLEDSTPKKLLRASTWQSLSTVTKAPTRSKCKPTGASKDHKDAFEDLHRPDIKKFKADRLVVTPRLQYHDVTPPNVEPGTIHSDESYFRTVYAVEAHEGTMAHKSPPSSSSSASTMSETPKTKLYESLNPALASPGVRLHAKSRPQKRKHSSIFKSLRRPALGPVSLHRSPGPESAKGTSTSPPAITINSPGESFGHRTRALFGFSSDQSSPSYFNSKRRTQRSSEASPISPGTVIEDTEPDSARKSMKTKRLAPIKRPSLRTKRPGLPHRDAQDVVPDIHLTSSAGQALAGVEMEDCRTPAATAEASHAPERRECTASTTETRVTDLKTDEPGLNPTSQEVRLQGSRISFRSLLFESSHPGTNVKRSLTYRTLRVKALKAIMSSPLLRRTRSGKKLQRKASHPAVMKGKQSTVTVSAQRSRSINRPVDVKKFRRSDLEVSEFYTTSYTKRYRDTQWAEEATIRNFIEESLNDDEDNDTMLGFETDVPDHLPGSPLCPLNVKHASRGRAICPLHRRRKRIVMTKRESTSKIPTVNNKPTIVYEGKRGETTTRQRSVEWADMM